MYSGSYGAPQAQQQQQQQVSAYEQQAQYQQYYANLFQQQFQRPHSSYEELYAFSCELIRRANVMHQPQNNYYNQIQSLLKSQGNSQQDEGDGFTDFIDANKVNTDNKINIAQNTQTKPEIFIGNHQSTALHQASNSHQYTKEAQPDLFSNLNDFPKQNNSQSQDDEFDDFKTVQTAAVPEQKAQPQIPAPSVAPITERYKAFEQFEQLQASIYQNQLLMASHYSYNVVPVQQQIDDAQPQQDRIVQSALPNEHHKLSDAQEFEEFVSPPVQGEGEKTAKNPVEDLLGEAFESVSNVTAKISVAAPVLPPVSNNHIKDKYDVFENIDDTQFTGIDNTKTFIEEFTKKTLLELEEKYGIKHEEEKQSASGISQTHKKAEELANQSHSFYQSQTSIMQQNQQNPKETEKNMSVFTQNLSIQLKEQEDDFDDFQATPAANQQQDDVFDTFQTVEVIQETKAQNNLYSSLNLTSKADKNSATLKPFGNTSPIKSVAGSQGSVQQQAQIPKDLIDLGDVFQQSIAPAITEKNQKSNLYDVFNELKTTELKTQVNETKNFVTRVNDNVAALNPADEEEFEEFTATPSPQPHKNQHLVQATKDQQAIADDFEDFTEVRQQAPIQVQNDIAQKKANIPAPQQQIDPKKRYDIDWGEAEEEVQAQVQKQLSKEISGQESNPQQQQQQQQLQPFSEKQNLSDSNKSTTQQCDSDWSEAKTGAKAYQEVVVRGSEQVPQQQANADLFDVDWGEDFSTANGSKQQPQEVQKQHQDDQITVNFVNGNLNNVKKQFQGDINQTEEDEFQDFTLQGVKNTNHASTTEKFNQQLQETLENTQESPENNYYDRNKQIIGTLSLEQQFSQNDSSRIAEAQADYSNSPADSSSQQQNYDKEDVVQEGVQQNKLQKNLNTIGQFCNGQTNKIGVLDASQAEEDADFEDFSTSPNQQQNQQNQTKEFNQLTQQVTVSNAAEINQSAQIQKNTETVAQQHDDFDQFAQPVAPVSKNSEEQDANQSKQNSKVDAQQHEDFEEFSEPVGHMQNGALKNENQIQQKNNNGVSCTIE